MSSGRGQGAQEREYAGWGGNLRSRARRHAPADEAALGEHLALGGGRALVRGAGRSYGDAALNGGGELLDLSGWTELEFDGAAGEAVCGAGLSCAAVVEQLAPRGWLFPALPGTGAVTVGGAVAADIHGKNHHRDGSLGRHLIEIGLVLPSGEAARCSPTERPALFWATIGGMGLTGAITRARLRLLPIASTDIEVRRERTGHLEQTLDRLTAGLARHQYAVAALDGSGRGRELGRGLVLCANHAAPPSSPARAGSPWGLPRLTPPLLRSPTAARALSAVYFHLQRRRPSEERMDPGRFFFPLDRLSNWGRLYGGRGFAQFHCVVPAASALRSLTALLERVERFGLSPFPGVLKCFGGSTRGGMLSFPMAGYSLALDFAVGADLPRLMAELEASLLDCGGRVYFAKDSFLSSGAVDAMYPRAAEFRELQAGLDPRGRWGSDLGRRLGLCQALH